MKARSRQNIYYHFTRSLVFFCLERRCVLCGALEELTFDMIQPDGSKGHHSRMSSCARASHYWKEFLKSNIQILCVKCNSRKKDKI